MQFGIDFGTTRTIVATADRGNYPVVSFLDPAGDWHDHIPSVVAEVDGELVFGHAAEAAGHDGAPMLRSFKRVLADPLVSGGTEVRVGAVRTSIHALLVDFLRHVRRELLENSSVGGIEVSDTTPEATVVAVPAHAHGPQRFLTLDAFRRAGFTVTAMVNEPSAAGFEYSHREGHRVTKRRTRIIVYDLGGGTFDASLVSVDGGAHTVLNSVGLNRLGGDDLDAALAELAYTRSGAAPLAPDAVRLLLEDARSAKEALAPQSRRILLDVADEPVIIPVADFYDQATPLVERTIDALMPLVGALEDADPDLTEIAGIYLVGGSSQLPLVARLLRERFGRRVQRAPLPAASTAVGLAIAADPDAGFSLTDRLSRGFGVFRERAGGSQLSFDALVTPDQVVRQDTAVTVTRRYRAAHNVGWFRFVEFATLDAAGEPTGDLVPFAEVHFPFEPHAVGRDDLSDVPVVRLEHGPRVEETYTIHPSGVIDVTITNLDTGFRMVAALGGSDASS